MFNFISNGLGNYKSMYFISYSTSNYANFTIWNICGACDNDCLESLHCVFLINSHKKHPVLFILLEWYNISKVVVYIISDILLGVQLSVIWSLTKFIVGRGMLQPGFLYNLVCDTSKLFSRFQIKIFVVRY